LWLISDEAYADFVYGNNPAMSPFVFPEIRPQLLIVRSFSKTYAMTGFRIGYVVAPEEIVQRLSTLQGHMTGNVCTFAQYGALCATEISRETREQRRLGYEKRRDCAVSLCRDLFDVIEPGGAFYLFPSLERYSARYGDDRKFSRYVLKEANVAVVPGTFFGAPGHIRLSFATSTERLTQGFARLKEVL
jgi:aspartate aminotransferase